MEPQQDSENAPKSVTTAQQQLEPILLPDPARFVLFPIKYHQVWEFYKKHIASFWTADEISFSEDIRHFESLTDDERFFIKHVLAFFAASDGIVNENLAINFIEEVQVFTASTPKTLTTQNY
tara:strand:- start:2573 stop:2938 length:366 start_codon:yes stop_codon:yes gene_type:complete